MAAVESIQQPHCMAQTVQQYAVIIEQGILEFTYTICYLEETQIQNIQPQGAVALRARN